MRASPARTRALSDATLTGLYFLYKYRFLTIPQFARIAGFSKYHAGEVLRGLERGAYVGFFGFLSIPGQGKTPKVYYLKRRGWALLRSEHYDDLIGEFSEVHREATWTPHMYHRLAIIDLLISAEHAVRKRPHLNLVRSFLEYRMVRRGHHVVRETTDYVGRPESSETKIVPDAAFILENVEAQKRALFFLEMDMATERVANRIRSNRHHTLYHKISQYDKYLQGLRYATTYGYYGDFRFFTLLFVTTTEKRIENIRRELQLLPEELAHYYRFTTYDLAMTDFFAAIWKSRALSDQTTYPLVRDSA